MKGRVTQRKECKIQKPGDLCARAVRTNHSDIYLSHWKVDQEASSFQNMCLSLSSPEVYPEARILVQVTCWYERNSSSNMRQGEKAANEDYLFNPATIGDE